MAERGVTEEETLNDLTGMWPRVPAMVSSLISGPNREIFLVGAALSAYLSGIRLCYTF
jgi:hypothetical protein